MATDVIAAIQTATTEPEGDAHEPETTCEELQLEAVRLAYKASRPDLVEKITVRLTNDSAKLQLGAYAAEADPASSREDRIAAWEAAAAGATDDDQRGTAAFALSSLGVWPVPYLDQAPEQGVPRSALSDTVGRGRGGPGRERGCHQASARTGEHQRPICDGTGGAV
ncbi:hypothetical protein GCM10023080_080310 [Streptomyces pseudoechinosporeus]